MENHYISLENREKLTINQVLDVEAFDEENLWANLKDGGMELTGEKLNIQRLDLQEGILIVTGKINSLSYNDKKVKEKSKLFKHFKKRT